MIPTTFVIESHTPNAMFYGLQQMASLFFSFIDTVDELTRSPV